MVDARFVMVVQELSDCFEVSINDMEEDNAQVFSCNVCADDLYFCKQELSQVLDLLNFQNNRIIELLNK